jgi:hypothetical protein
LVIRWDRPDHLHPIALARLHLIPRPGVAGINEVLRGQQRVVR